MNPMNHQFRERLLNAEQVTPALKDRYHKELQAMLEKQLTGTMRWAWFGSAVMGVGFASLFGALAIFAPADFPWWGRLTFAAGSLFGIGWALLGFKVFRARTASMSNSIPGRPAAWPGRFRF